MLYNEIYELVSFEKIKINYNKIMMSTKNDLIIGTRSAKQHKAQYICNQTHEKFATNEDEREFETIG
jgi:hypothetical protein